MPLLTIEKDENRKEELIAKVDGIEIPLITKIEIISEVGTTTKVHITCIVGIMRDGEGVLIKESALMQ